MLFLTILAFALIGMFEIPPLVHRKQWRELIASSILLLIGLILAILLSLGVPIPPVSTSITKLFTPLLDALNI